MECFKCHHIITDEPLVCDGICGNKFHQDCARRSTRHASSNSYTCPSCTEIKSCHILKAILLLNSKMDTLYDKTSELEQSIASLRSDYNVLLSDRETILSRIDQLTLTNSALEETLSKFADLANKNNSLTKKLENTLMDINLSPDLSYIKEDISNVSSSLRGLEERFRKMTVLPAPTTPTTGPSKTCTAQSRSPTTSRHTPTSPHEVNLSPKSCRENFTPHLNQNLSPATLDAHPPRHSINVEVISGASDLPINYPGTNPVPISWISEESVKSSSLYVGRCEPSTTTEAIKIFLSSQLHLPFHSIKCRKLVNPNRPLTDYSFVSFKVDIPSTHVHSALSHTWPSFTRVSTFKNRMKSDTNKEPRAPSSPSKNLHRPDFHSAT